MKKQIFIFLVAIAGLTCSSKEKTSYDKTSLATDTSIIEKKQQVTDSIVTKEGNYYQFIFLDSDNFKIKWGNKDQSYISEKVFEKWGSELYLNSSTKDVILLTRSCGTGCRQAIFLILNHNENGLREYLFAKEFDLNNKLVAFAPDSQDTLLVIENFSTGKSIALANLDLCPAAVPFECIDSVSFSNRSLYIRWQGSKWTREKLDPREKRIDVSSLLSAK